MGYIDEEFFLRRTDVNNNTLAATRVSEYKHKSHNVTGSEECIVETVPFVLYLCNNPS